MTINPLSLRENYWESFKFQEDDFDYLYNYLLEIETPQTPKELVNALIKERIRIEKDTIQSQPLAQGKYYFPKDHYTVGEKLIFPALEWQEGVITSLRPGINPELPSFEVIEVALSNHGKKLFAAGLDDHILNQPIAVNWNDPNFNPEYVIKNYARKLINTLNEAFESNPDLVRIAGRWFPRALLVDVNIGYLNMAEALLDMEGGGPLTTQKILEQIELPTDVNLKLTEFSLNLALDEDGRFDEVGPSGEVLWYLRRLEPANVQNPPIYLRYNPISYDSDEIAEFQNMLKGQISDELEPEDITPNTPADENSISFSLIFPHWRGGTIPLSNRIMPLFPTAIEAPRIRITFVDAGTNKRYSGWVIRGARYAYGLQEWYQEQQLIPGSIIRIERGQKPEEIIVRPDKRRPTREWIRTALAGTDGGIVFAMLKQHITASYDERMVISIPDVHIFDQFWETGGKQKLTLDKAILMMMRELAKLTPQGHVHAQELYAAVNIVRRCPPGPILHTLSVQPWATHLGDLYFRLDEAIQEE